MTRVAIGVVVGLGILVSASACTTAPSGALATSALEGAWTAEEVSWAKPVDWTVTKPVGLFVFSGRHYSQLVVYDPARPNFPAEGGYAGATADQLRATLGPFRANAGTFTVSGNTIRLTVVAAKNPSVMAADSFREWSFTVDGDSLVMTEIRTQNGPWQNPQTIRFRRAA